MNSNVWTNAEKKAARRAFDAAVQKELGQLIAEFKQRASATTEPETLWEIRDWLDSREREINNEFEFRYSLLIFVFANLLSAGKITIQDLGGLSEQKLAEIEFISNRRLL